MNVIDQKNNLALKHRVQYLGRYDAPVFDLSKEYPNFGYVDVNVGNLQPCCMFSNNDCSVAQRFFWCGSDAYERHSLLIWSALASKSSITIAIGAYTGIYSISAALANPKSKVFAFEALDRVYFRLLLNKQVNKLGNLQLFNKAVANEDKLVTLNVFSGESVLVTASSLFEKKLRRPIIDKKTITAISLDSQFQGVSGRISLVKIDAEGAEHLVLSGMEGIITRDYPDMLIEILSDAQLELITRFFDSRVYNYFQINDDLRELKQIKSLQVATDMSTLNTLITTKTIEELSLFVGLALRLALSESCLRLFRNEVVSQLSGGRAICLGYPEVGSSVEVLKSIFNIPIQQQSLQEILRLLKFDEFDIADVSDYEGSNVIFDLNIPITHLKTYDLIVDNGTVEHCFNVCQALFNIKKLCAINGIIFHLNPANWFGHGFYNFSPCFYFDFYESNGFEVRCFLRDVSSGNYSEIFYKPKVTKVLLNRRYTVHAVARKIAEMEDVIPFQRRFLHAIKK